MRILCLSYVGTCTIHHAQWPKCELRCNPYNLVHHHCHLVHNPKPSLSLCSTNLNYLVKIELCLRILPCQVRLGVWALIKHDLKYWWSRPHGSQIQCVWVWQYTHFGLKWLWTSLCMVEPWLGSSMKSIANLPLQELVNAFAMPIWHWMCDNASFDVGPPESGCGVMCHDFFNIVRILIRDSPLWRLICHLLLNNVFMGTSSICLGGWVGSRVTFSAPRGGGTSGGLVC